MRKEEGSWNIYKTAAETFVVEIETDGTWGEAIPVTLERLNLVMPEKAATILRERIATEQEPPDLLYGDDIDTEKVYGWSLEFANVGN